MERESSVKRSSLERSLMLENAVARIQINPSKPTGIFVHGLHKSGTVFLYQLFQRLARARKIESYSSNHAQPNDHLVTASMDHDFCLCPIRNYSDHPAALPQRLQIKRIFHVRDPRDTLVSQYFSYGWRHTEEGFHPGRHRQRDLIQSIGIDDYVLHQQGVIGPLKKRYADLIHRPISELQNVVTYEQMVTDFPSWLEKVIRPFEFRFPSLIKKRFAFRYRNEFRPDPNPASHKRNITPGDYLKKLKPETISKLNEIFEPELRTLNYSLDDSLQKAA